MFLSTLTAFFFIPAVAGSVPIMVALVALHDVAVCCVPFCFEALPIDKEANLDVSVCCFSIFSIYNNRLVGGGFMLFSSLA